MWTLLTGKMQSRAISAEIYASAAVFYSTLSASKCGAEIIDIPWHNNVDLVHIYRTEVPWTPVELEKDRNHFAFVAWVTAFLVLIILTAIVYLYCTCRRICSESRRQSTNAALVPTATHEDLVAYDAEAGGRIHNPVQARTSILYGRGVVNFTFTSSPGDPVPELHIVDGPPEYSSVISQTLPSSPANSFSHPVGSGEKRVETPPPAYISVAPFKG